MEILRDIKTNTPFLVTVVFVVFCISSELTAQQSTSIESQTEKQRLVKFSACENGDLCFEEHVVTNEVVSYEYYEGIWTSLPSFDNLLPTLTGSYPSISLEPAGRTDNFAFRFSAQLYISDPGNYTFFLTSDDGSALYVNQIKHIDNDGLHQREEKSISLDLLAGVHAFTIEYFEKTGAESLSVEIAGPDIIRQEITPFLSPSTHTEADQQATKTNAKKKENLSSEATEASTLSSENSVSQSSQPEDSTSIDQDDSPAIEDTSSAIGESEYFNNTTEARESSPVTDTEIQERVEVDKPKPKTDKPSRPGLFVVDEDTAERALERSLVLLDALLLAPGKVDIGVEFSYGLDVQLQPTLVVVSDEETGEANNAVAVTEVTNRTTGLIFDLRLGLPLDSQANISIPFFDTSSGSNLRFEDSSIESQSVSENSNGAFSIGIIKTLFNEQGRIPDIIASVTYSESDNTDDPAALTLGLTTTKRQDPLIFTASASFTQSESKNGFKNGDRTELSIGTVLAASPNTSLEFSIDQTFANESTIDNIANAGSGIESAAATIGASSVVSQNVFLNGSLSFGLSEFAQDYVFSFGVSRRLSF